MSADDSHGELHQNPPLNKGQIHTKRHSAEDPAKMAVLDRWDFCLFVRKRILSTVVFYYVFFFCIQCIMYYIWTHINFPCEISFTMVTIYTIYCVSVRCVQRPHPPCAVRAAQCPVLQPAAKPLTKVREPRSDWYWCQCQVCGVWTTQWTLEMSSYILGGHNIKAQQQTERTLWDQIKWPYNQGHLKIKGCKIEGALYVGKFVIFFLGQLKLKLNEA